MIYSFNKKVFENRKIQKPYHYWIKNFLTLVVLKIFKSIGINEYVKKIYDLWVLKIIKTKSATSIVNRYNPISVVKVNYASNGTIIR